MVDDAYWKTYWVVSEKGRISGVTQARGPKLYPSEKMARAHHRYKYVRGPNGFRKETDEEMDKRLTLIPVKLVVKRLEEMDG